MQVGNEFGETTFVAFHQTIEKISRISVADLKIMKDNVIAFAF